MMRCPRLDRRAAVGGSLLMLCFGLQGCDLPHIEGYFPIGSLDVETHKVANWRQKEEVYIKYSYKSPANGVLKFNSCMDHQVTAMNVCGGHGFCAPFDRMNIVKPYFFCKCDLGWAGPECTTKQKSQTIAWLLSLFLGPFGVDQLYLDWTFWFMMKLLGLFVGVMLSLLGFEQCGIMLVLSYWFSDIVHIGSAPVRAVDAKVAADLPRWAFAVFTMLFFAFLGFGLGVRSVYFNVKLRRRFDDHQKYYGSTQSFNHRAV